MHHIPNVISILRAIMVLPIALLLLKNTWSTAFILIFIAGISDGIDGYLARKYHWQSQLGAILDPLADKLLIVIIFIIMAYKDIIPVWLTLLVVGRDIVILFGAIFYQRLTKDRDISPLFISKVNTALQIIFVLMLMLHLAISPLPETVMMVAQLIVAAIAIVSGISYIVCWTGYYKEYLKRRSN